MRRPRHLMPSFSGVLVGLSTSLGLLWAFESAPEGFDCPAGPGEGGEPPHSRLDGELGASLPLPGGIFGGVVSEHGGFLLNVAKRHIGVPPYQFRRMRVVTPLPVLRARRLGLGCSRALRAAHGKLKPRSVCQGPFRLSARPRPKGLRGALTRHLQGDLKPQDRENVARYGLNRSQSSPGAVSPPLPWLASCHQPGCAQIL